MRPRAFTKVAEGPTIHPLPPRSSLPVLREDVEATPGGRGGSRTRSSSSKKKDGQSVFWDGSELKAPHPVSPMIGLDLNLDEVPHRAGNSAAPSATEITEDDLPQLP